jgi:hypothetical protein
MHQPLAEPGVVSPVGAVQTYKALAATPTKVMPTLSAKLANVLPTATPKALSTMSASHLRKVGRL